MIGGDGSDRYYVHDVGDIVTETNATATGGSDTVYSYLNSYILGANIENGRILATGAATMSGNALNNVLTGDIGDNALNGKTGADTMIGGDGSDRYYVDNVADIVTETNATATGGSDTVYSYLNSYVLGANIENGRILATGAATMSGNSLNNTLIGDTGANTLTGAGGKDTLTGGAGVDQFVFTTASDSGTTSTTRDVITDFVAGTDKIDLSAIDANTLTTGNTAFTTLLSSSTEFTAAGQLKLVGNVLYGNTDSTATAEFSIELAGLSALGLNDFIL
jgi:Ca2+-binding RTX toxin-like protein